jgi:hypothetical protein
MHVRNKSNKPIHPCRYHLHIELLKRYLHMGNNKDHLHILIDMHFGEENLKIVYLQLHRHFMNYQGLLRMPRHLRYHLSRSKIRLTVHLN